MIATEAITNVVNDIALLHSRADIRLEEIRYRKIACTKTAINNILQMVETIKRGLPSQFQRDVNIEHSANPATRTIYHFGVAILALPPPSALPVAERIEGAVAETITLVGHGGTYEGVSISPQILSEIATKILKEVGSVKEAEMYRNTKHHDRFQEGVCRSTVADMLPGSNMKFLIERLATVLRRGQCYVPG